MISLRPSPVFTSSRGVSGKLHTENENRALSPKRSFAQLEEDQPSQPVQPSKRAPLDPLSASDLENRRSRGPQSADSATYHAIVTPSDIPVLHPEQPVSAGSCGMQRSGISDALVCSWPPPAPIPGTAGSSNRGPVHSPDEKMSSRAVFPEPTFTLEPPDYFSTEPIVTMTKQPTPTTGWKSETLLQPIRLRTNSMPSVRRPPAELWRSDSGPIKVGHELVDIVDSFAYPAPPGLPPRISEVKRSGPSSVLLPRGSVSLSLALGSQPLGASEHTKAVPPIGAERSRVISITSLKSHIRNSPATPSRDPFESPWCSPRLSSGPQTKWKKGTYSSLERVQVANVSKEDLERLLRNTVHNKHAPRVISPLSPLRTSTPAIDLSVDPAYRLRMPSALNTPSPRYCNRLPRRARTLCDMYQSFDWNATCMHCQECKRDSLCKRLLAFRYRQQQVSQVQRNRPVGYPSRAATTPVVDDDRLVLADRIREVFAYEIDEEEKSLWEEVAAVTGGDPMSFARVGAPCAAAVHRRDMDDGSDDGVHDDHLGISDEGLLANESATLFREVSVY